MQLSIIIPSYNTKNLLKECLASIFVETGEVKFEVIVVDNHSQDGSGEMVKKEFPQVKLISLKKNVGFGKANNLGVKKAQGEWLLFLNSDTQIMNRAIDEIFREVSSDKFQATSLVVGCQLLNPDGTIQPSVGFFPNLGRVGATMFFLDDLPFFKRWLKPYQQDDIGFYHRQQEVDWVTGAFLLVKKKDFEEISGFDERIFMYAEEVDLCYRLKQKGAKVLYLPMGKITHHKGASSLDGFEAAVIGEYKGLINFFKKHRPPWQLAFLRVGLALGALLRIGLFGIIDGRKRQIYEKALSSL